MTTTIPVLLYHHVNPHRGDTVTVTPEAFSEQMRFLAVSGYRTLRLNEILSYARGDADISEKAAVVTFDDGWLDTYIWAFPILREYGIHVAQFLIVDRVERASEKVIEVPRDVPDHNTCKSLIAQGEAGKVVLNWDIVAELGSSGLVEFHSHTMGHERCDGLSRERLESELEKSKKLIETRTGKPCTCLAWPYGRYDDAAVGIATSLGYEGMFTTNAGIVTKGSDSFHINRIFVQTEDIEVFKANLNNAEFGN